MKKLKSLPTFVAGMATAFALTACVTSALAASGAVQFNQFTLRVNGADLCTPGEGFKNASGVTVPSTITYMDEEGGRNTYISSRLLAQSLSIPIYYDDPHVLRLEMPVPEELGPTRIPSEWQGGGLGEIAPIQPPADATVLESASVFIPEADQYENFMFQLDPALGDTVSVTVTSDSDYPYIFGLGFNNDPESNDGYRFNSVVQAHQSVTRTMTILPDAEEIDRLFVHVGNPDDLNRLVRASVSVEQFFR